MALSVVTVAVFLTCILWASVCAQSNICYEKADILFIMDSSGSVESVNFRKQLQFAATIVNNFKVGVTQFSVIRFDSDANLTINFNDFSDNAALKNAIVNTDYPGGGTDTAAALRLARETAFTSSRGARTGVPKIAIVSTDGYSNNPNETATEAQNLKKTNVLILSIGIGDEVNKPELQTIATYPDDVFTVGDYSQLVSIVYDYSELVCQEIQQFKCTNQADIFFFLDASDGVPQAVFNNELTFVSNISSRLDLNNVHIGAATFGGSTVQKYINLGQFTDQFHLSQVLSGITYLGGVTDTNNALTSVTNQKLFDLTSGGRPEAAKIVFILTDGGSVTATQAAVTATQLRLTGVNIVTVGVLKPNTVELKNLVGHTVLDVITNLANPMIAIDRIQTLTAIQECSLPSTAIRNVSNYCRQYNLENGIHPHPYDCTRYIECTFLRTSIMNCSTPLIHMVYNAAIQTCDYPGHVKPDPCNPFNSNVTPPTVVVTTPSTVTAKPCHKGLLDILFIFDGSGNVSNSDFREELRIATNLAEYFNFSSETVQFAGVSFGTNVKHIFNFDDFSDYKPLEEAILNSKYDGSDSNTFLALEDALSFISSGHGSRPSAPKLAIVFSSGRSTNSERTLQAATALKTAGVHIITVGNSSPDVQQLEAIASSPSEVFVNNFNGLLRSVRTYSNTTCNVIDEWICRGIQFSDVIFIVDSSASISTDEYKGLLSFVIDVTSKFTISPVDMRFGGVIFSQDTSKLFDLKDFTSHAALSSAILSAAHLDGGTDTAKAINFVREQLMFSSANGGRDNATKIVIILTDGRSNSINDTVTAAQRLKASGVKFIAVGIGSEVYDEELRQLASDSDSLFFVPGFDALKELNDSVTRQVCHSSKNDVNVPQYSILCSQYSWADGRHPNPNDCSTFVECNSFVTTLFSCANGEAYDPTQARCTDKSIAHKCDDPNYFGPVASTIATVLETTRGPIIVDVSNLCAVHSLADGNYPNPNKCNSFIECTAQGTTSQLCPEGLNFNTGNGVCDDVHVIDCQVNYHFYDKP